MTYIEIKTNEICRFILEKRKEFQEQVKDFIAKNSPIQIGDVVLDTYYNKNKNVKITEILLLMSPISVGGDCISFYYRGKLINKKGEVIPNRKTVTVQSFEFKGERYTCPSYNRMIVEFSGYHYFSEHDFNE